MWVLLAYQDYPSCFFFLFHPFSGYFSGQPADYLFMLIFNSICLVVISLFLGLMVLSPSLIFSTLYIWCQINKDGIVTFWFGIQVKVSRE